MDHEHGENSRRNFLIQAGAFSTAMIAGVPAVIAQNASGDSSSRQSAPGQMMMTIFLRHDETKTLDEINNHWLSQELPACRG